LHQPIFIHPQIPSNELRDAAYRGLDPLIDLGLASFGWGWHMDAGLSALRLILRGTFDRYPEPQLVLGHWGEMLLFWMDRADGLSGIATHLVLFSTDYPFHRPGAAAVEQFFDAIPDPSNRSKIASGDATALFRLAWPNAPGR
jgi:predicted TIM-barrel fold metal-dependent hydrolase